ncbi:hypothetical protein HD554DRAFT_2102507 [Boletus coccyginus]|nr:hypothetical protein HD554DRAFT_2102507 [Boletus coccyginus]
MSYQYPFIPGHSSMPATPQTTYRWDDGDSHQQQQQQQQQDQQQQLQHLEHQVLQHPLQHQPERPQDAYVPAASATTVQLQEQVPIVPSQNPRRSGSVVEGDEPQLRLQHVPVPAILHPEHMRLPMIDTNRAYHVGTSASPPSGPSSAGPSGAFHAFHGSAGPVRAHISPVHTGPRAAAHPYRRPQSATGVAIARSRRELEDVQSVRYSRQASSSSSVPAPPPGTATTTPRGLPAAAKMISTTKGLVNPGYSATSANVVIRTDIHFNSDTSVLTALCELPGRCKGDVNVVLSTNAVNRVRQVVVTAKPPQDLADAGYVLRERRLGNVSRTFVVPSQTTPDDISVEIRDGLLSLKIQCPPPSPEDDSQEIVIR